MRLVLEQRLGVRQTQNRFDGAIHRMLSLFVILQAGSAVMVIYINTSERKVQIDGLEWNAMFDAWIQAIMRGNQDRNGPCSLSFQVSGQGVYPRKTEVLSLLRPSVRENRWSSRAINHIPHVSPLNSRKSPRHISLRWSWADPGFPVGWKSTIQERGGGQRHPY